MKDFYIFHFICKHRILPTLKEKITAQQIIKFFFSFSIFSFHFNLENILFFFVFLIKFSFFFYFREFLFFFNKVNWVAKVTVEKKASGDNDKIILFDFSNGWTRRKEKKINLIQEKLRILSSNKKKVKQSQMLLGQKKKYEITFTVQIV